MSEFFSPTNAIVSSILSAVAIIIYFVLSWLIKKLFKKNTNKGLAVLNLFLNLFLAAAFIVSILFILGLNITAVYNKVVSLATRDNLKVFLTENISKIVGVILTIVIASIIMSSFIAILKATKARRPEDQKRKRTLYCLLLFCNNNIQKHLSLMVFQ